jgi:hypothetical protein
MDDARERRRLRAPASLGEDADREFAGTDHELAVVPARARALLLRFDQRSAHYDVRFDSSPFPK